MRSEAELMSELELIIDGDGLAILGRSSDVERFFLSSALDRVPSRDLELHRLASYSGIGGTALKVGADMAENSGRWVKLTAESAQAVKKYGLMPTKNGTVSHAMIGKPGNIQQWIQIDNLPLLASPFALTAVSAMMQQQAMQQQMDEIVAYLQKIDEKVEDILRGQKDAVLADMIGIDLMIEEALTVRNQVGKVSEITWSKVQSGGMTIARTQGYALRQLDAIAEKLAEKADVGDVARATAEAEPKVREWLAVLARTFQLQDAVSILELDRVLDSAPHEVESHRLGLKTARENRLELIARSTGRLLTQMDETVHKANTKVLLNPFDAPAAVKSSNQLAIGVLDFRDGLGVERDHETKDAKRWRQAFAETRDKVYETTSEGVAAAGRLSAKTIDRTTEIFRSVDLDGDGIADRSRAATAADEIGSAVKGAATGVAEALGTLFRRKPHTDGSSSQASSDGSDPQ